MGTQDNDSPAGADEKMIATWFANFLQRALDEGRYKKSSLAKALGIQRGTLDDWLEGSNVTAYNVGRAVGLLGGYEELKFFIGEVDETQFTVAEAPYNRRQVYLEKVNDITYVCESVNDVPENSPILWNSALGKFRKMKGTPESLFMLDTGVDLKLMETPPDHVVLGTLTPLPDFTKPLSNSNPRKD